ncbi:uncharacterized protein LOC133728963 [Rosa rugosa]|uniref:uncharacterized protein LOC133728963 n=1 Tax=Rosa rugosa TaxID=74645 RepID=UPI002B40BCC8|nr:uncharacterized protein LOC133728963 [Rosa rugosa]XP_062012409.1 uncharacterized protein LOC133728963 [Rosa rugosa]XP_062012410.1 uncharacterized protein LOC133728963 [Rosa rugosa]
MAFPGYYSEQVYSCNTYSMSGNNSYSWDAPPWPKQEPYNYNLGWRDHSNYSWSENSYYETAQWSYPSSNVPSSYPAPIYLQEDPTIKEMVVELLKRSEKFDQEVAILKQDQSKLEERQSKLAQTLSDIELQILRLANAWEEEDVMLPTKPEERFDFQLDEEDEYFEPNMKRKIIDDQATESTHPPSTNVPMELCADKQENEEPKDEIIFEKVVRTHTSDGLDEVTTMVVDAPNCQASMEHQICESFLSLPSKLVLPIIPAPTLELICVLKPPSNSKDALLPQSLQPPWPPPLQLLMLNLKFNARKNMKWSRKKKIKRRERCRFEKSDWKIGNSRIGRMFAAAISRKLLFWIFWASREKEINFHYEIGL